MTQQYANSSIVTRYIPATNTRGSRIVAECRLGKVIVPYNSQASETEFQSHVRAREALIEKCKITWPGTWIVGSLPNDKGMCHVIIR